MLLLELDDFDYRASLKNFFSFSKITITRHVKVQDFRFHHSVSTLKI